ncbi:MAG: preprotein translocase subunit SecE [Firmicutes bacterium]|nr:preprotein translocase subunit SecE [Bacillota bacterium]MCL5038679.1 preprotein translocase subunit SecE [Bacillota bacterium]
MELKKYTGAVSRAMDVKRYGGGITRYFREVRNEVRKVIWPNRKQTMIFTAVVLITVAILAVFIWVADVVLSFGLGFLVR